MFNFSNFGVLTEKAFLRKTFIILLLSCLLLPFTGTYLFYHFKEIQIKEKVNLLIKNNIEEKDIITLRFSDEEIKTRLKWKHSREFIFEGQMYDIVDQGVEGNITWYRCYRDHKETRLYKEKEKLIARALGNDPFQKKQTERIKQLFKTVFQNESFSWNINLPNPSVIHYSLFTIHYSLFLSSPPTPPPKCA
jgi:hypothetical protein